MRLYYFKDQEFRGQLDSIDPRLLYLLDAFRSNWGLPVIISPHPHAIGREDGDSQHNWRKHGQIRAIDLFPQGIIKIEDAQEAIECAKDVGFTGIGIYPHWTRIGRRECGMHLDVRADRHPESPATWGGINENGKQVYVSVEEALEKMEWA